METLIYEMVDAGWEVRIRRPSTEFVFVTVIRGNHSERANGNTIENALQQIKTKAPWTTR